MGAHPLAFGLALAREASGRDLGLVPPLPMVSSRDGQGRKGALRTTRLSSGLHVAGSGIISLARDPAVGPRIPLGYPCSIPAPKLELGAAPGPASLSLGPQNPPLVPHGDCE